MMFNVRPCHHHHIRYFSSTRLKILVFGSSSFGLNTLQTLRNDLADQRTVVESLALVTGKQTPMRIKAVECEITTLPYPPNIEKGEYDLGVVVSFGHLIPSRVIEKFPRGVLNIHPSLLPRWRGAAPVSHTILAGDRNTGVSIMEIRPKHFDIGPILVQKTVPVEDNITTSKLSEQLSLLGASMLMETLSDYDSIRAGAREQSNTDGVSYAHKLKTDMTFVNWERQTCADIDRQYRALHEQIPLRCRYADRPIQLLDMVPPNVSGLVLQSDDLDVPSGTVRYAKEHDFIKIKARDGWLCFRSVVYKKRMTASSFHNGYLSKDYNRGLLMESMDNTILRYIDQAKVPSSRCH